MVNLLFITEFNQGCFVVLAWFCILEYGNMLENYLLEEFQIIHLSLQIFVLILLQKPECSCDLI